MSIYYNNTYVTGRVRKKKPKVLTVNYSRSLTGYEPNRKRKCKKCGNFVLLIHGKQFSTEPGEAGCHEKHRC